MSRIQMSQMKSHSLYKPRHRDTFFSRSISAWNILPPEVAQAPSLGTFISRVSSLTGRLHLFFFYVCLSVCVVLFAFSTVSSATLRNPKMTIMIKHFDRGS